jgi:hypothetical protein
MQKMGKATSTLAFLDIGKFRLAIRNQPARIKPMAKTAKAEAKQKLNNVFAVPKFENPINARPPGKRAATKQPSPMIILRILI